MKVLVTGGSGLLGSSLIYLLRDTFKTSFVYNEHKVELDNAVGMGLDLTDKERTLRVVAKLKPGCIIHTAALISTDYCEANPKKAEEVNVGVTKTLALAVKKNNSKLVYVSTDYVFDGKGGMYTEEDTPNPLNVYGKTKLDGEKIVLENEGNLVIRTSIYGWNIQKKFSFAEMVINKLANNEEVPIFTDQFSSLMLTNNLAEALAEMIKKEKVGLFHIASDERISKFDFACKVAKVFNLEKNLIKPIKTKDLNLKAERPLDVSLNVTKAKIELDVKLLNIKEGLTKLKKLKEEGYIKNFKRG